MSAACPAASRYARIHAAVCGLIASAVLLSPSPAVQRGHHPHACEDIRRASARITPQSAGGDHDISLVPYRGDLDVDGVGELIRLAVDRGRAARPGLKLGICGEHGGDPMSIGFYQAIGLDYVSCSPFRIPIARLAAAQAVLAVKGRDTTV
jgi:PEP-utilising enzyme, PEP-binding domain